MVDEIILVDDNSSSTQLRKDLNLKPKFKLYEMFICIQNSLKRKPLDEMVQLFQRPIIKVIRQTQNYGEAKSRANALIYTNNDFVLFLDSFVECLPGYLIQMINLLQEGLYFSRHFN